MKRWAPLAAAFGLVGALALAQSSTAVQFIQRAVLDLTRGGTINGDLTVNGDAGVTKNVNVVGTLIAGVVDGGTVQAGALGVSGQSTLAGATANLLKVGAVDAGNITSMGRYCTDAACTTNYLSNDTFGTLNITGPVSGSNNIAAVGTIQASDYFVASGGIRNTGTSAPCTSNTGAVCVNDVGGLAVGDGSGATVATVSAAGAAVLNGGVTIGSGGQAITASTTGSATLDFASALVSTCSADLTIAVTATASSTVDLSVPSGSVAAGSIFFAWVSGSNVVSVRHCCGAGASCDPASGVFVVRVFVP